MTLNEFAHAQKGAWLANIKATDVPRNGTPIILFALVVSAQQRTTKEQSPYLELLLADASGRAAARVWDKPEKALITAGVVAKVEIVETKTFQGKLQISVRHIRAATESEYDWADMLPAAPRPVSAMLTEVIDAISALPAGLREAVGYLYSKHQKEIEAAPATGKTHHAYRGGVLTLVTQALKLTEAQIGQWPDVDAGLLRAGILVAPLGRVFAYDPLSFETTTPGELLGLTGLALLTWADAVTATPTLSRDHALRVSHMIASQLGRQEWGALRRPQTAEAMALHIIMENVAQMDRYTAMLASRDPGTEWTERDPFLGMALYAGAQEVGPLAGVPADTEAGPEPEPAA